MSGLEDGATAGEAATEAAAIGAATGLVATGATVGAVTAFIDGVVVGPPVSGGGVGVWPSAVKARAMEQMLVVSVIFIIVVCIEMQKARRLDSVFSN